MGRMKVPAWLVALLILIGVCAIGVYIINTADSGIAEAFSAASEARAACERNMKKCLDPVSKGGDGDTLANCTRKYQTCIGNSGTSIDSSGQTIDTQGARNLQRALQACETDKAACILNPRGRNCNTEYTQCRNRAYGSGEAGAANPDYTRLRDQVFNDQNNKFSTDSQDYSKELKTFLKAVQGNVGVDYPDPTDEQIERASGGGLLNNDTSFGANYSGSTTTITPGQIPPALLRDILVKLNSEKGTQAQQIRESAPIAPSLRQQIRNDVQDAVEDELDTIRNEYEVKYVTDDS